MARAHTRIPTHPHPQNHYKVTHTKNEDDNAKTKLRHTLVQKWRVITTFKPLGEGLGSPCVAPRCVHVLHCTAHTSSRIIEQCEHTKCSVREGVHLRVNFYQVYSRNQTASAYVTLRKGGGCTHGTTSTNSCHLL